MSEDPRPEPSSSHDLAESLFCSWLERARDGDAESLDALCLRHPQVAEQLRAFHGHIHGLAGVFDATLAEALRSDSGANSSDREDESAAQHALSEVLQRLVRHAPPESRYEERGRIAAGGMGAIERAYDVDLRREIAKKTILEDEPASASTLGRFLEEAQVTGQLDHPGIVPVHELGIDAQGRVFFTMALVGGRDLSELYPLARAEDEGWSITRAVDVLLRVCETLAYAHTKGVIHRDLKPANVMVGAFGEVYVMDWGLARVVDRGSSRSAAGDGPARVTTDRREASDRDPLSPLKTQEGSVAGTPQFMSPEQARGEHEALDARSDVYAVGAMLYALLAGHSPYVDRLPDGKALQFLQAIWEGPPTPLAPRAPAAPAELIAIAEKAMAREPAVRYAGALAMAEDLRAYLEGRVVRAYESGAWAELRKWVGRNKGFAASLAAALVAVVAGLSGTAFVEARGRRQVQEEQTRTLRLSDSKVLNDLVIERDQLWPAGPETSAPLAGWLARAGGLLERRGRHEAHLESLHGQAEAAETISSESSLPGQEVEWQREILVDLLTQLDELPLWIERMRARHLIAATLEERTLTGEEALSRWKAAMEDMKGLETYAGLSMTPQLGLSPLRRDPESGLWEFWVVASGAEPRIDLESNAWIIEPEIGIVLVLLPGGSFRVGPTSLSKEHPFYDPFVEAEEFEDERASFDIDLDAFFLSKYEMTQGQWERIRYRNPSYHAHGGTHPVDTVSWFECQEAARRLGLVLPTEAQWEFACRSGEATRFATGQANTSLVGYANLYEDNNPRGQALAPWPDPYDETSAPVGSFKETSYGLHDLHGNLWEWCRDLYGFEGEPRSGDGLREPQEVPASDIQLSVMKGGSYWSNPMNARITHRFDWYRNNAEPDVGLRPARAITE